MLIYFCSPVLNLKSGKNRGVAQLASVLAWGARGRKFESSRPDKRKTGESRFFAL